MKFKNSIIQGPRIRLNEFLFPRLSGGEGQDEGGFIDAPRCKGRPRRGHLQSLR